MASTKGLATLLLLTGLGCSGTSSAARDHGGFGLLEISVPNGAEWQINRPIHFKFSEPVDFDSVNSNSLLIHQPNGVTAIGDYSADPLDPRVVIYQPKCPNRADLSDSGFLPGGVTYRIDLFSESEAGSSIRSTSGKGLDEGATLTFRTPDSMFLTELFFDTRPGPAKPVIAPGVGSYLELEGVPIWFQLDPEDGSGALPSGFLVPNNLYSDSSSQVSFLLRLDQPVNPSSENISGERLRLEYLDSSSIWSPLVTEVRLESNCTGTGAAVQITPVGVLPQGRLMRLVIAREFQDLIGETNALPLNRFGNMTADVIADGAGAPVETADEILEDFSAEGFEDEISALQLPRAKWGEGGLEAAFEFDGTGGPAGKFDLHIPPNTEIVFDTTATIFFGGENGLPQYSQLAVNGRLDVRNLYIPTSSALRVQGPNPARIIATGEVRIEGSLTVNGTNAATVTTVNSPHQPESGGAGQGGGGAGGTGSYITNAVTLRGGNGEGAFGVANLGGEGGESGWAQQGQTDGTFRRSGGGGGGTLGNPQRVYWTDGMGETFSCVDQSIYGLDAESGHVGGDLANSSQGDHIPWGGRAGPSPFGVLPGEVNDFWGSMIENVGSTDPRNPERLIFGELEQLTPGAGGGAGGDATYVNPADTYPPENFYWSNQDKGCGGGGGAGALSIFSIGDIIIGPSGVIVARGGHGGGGEHSISSFRTAGGSGGGSGGHIVLQTAGVIDLSAVAPGLLAIDVRGGQGGAGERIFGEPEPNGGADNSGNTTEIWFDAKHVGSNGTDNPWEEVPAICIDESPNGYLGSLPGAGDNSFVVRCAGGDGGPGLIQLHVQDLIQDLYYPGGDSTLGDHGDESQLAQACRPMPHGYDLENQRWNDQLLPIFGRRSMAQSRWIALGETTVDPLDPELGELAFLFDGTLAGDGSLRTTAGIIDDLAPLLTTPNLELDSNDASNRTALVDVSGLGGDDQIYLRNPRLLREFLLVVGDARFTLSEARYLAGTEELALVVSSDGPSLAEASGSVELRPRYFGVTTEGVADALPASAKIQLLFELAQEGSPGAPDPNHSTGFVTELAGQDLGSLGVDPRLVRFMRYRVTFDIAAGAADLNFDTPRPRLEFLRIPYRF